MRVWLISTRVNKPENEDVVDLGACRGDRRDGAIAAVRAIGATTASGAADRVGLSAGDTSGEFG